MSNTERREFLKQVLDEYRADHARNGQELE